MVGGNESNYANKYYKYSAQAKLSLSKFLAHKQGCLSMSIASYRLSCVRINLVCEYIYEIFKRIILKSVYKKTKSALGHRWVACHHHQAHEKVYTKECAQESNF